MTNRRAHVIAGVLLTTALVVLTACAPTVNGEPSSTQQSSTPATTTESTESSAPRFADLLPPRPRELDLDGVDPCVDLLTDQQLRDLNYDLGYNRPPSPGHDSIHGGPTCVFGSNGGSGGVNRNVDTLITISTTEGALAWVTDPRRAPDTRPDVVTINGFSAIVLPHPYLPHDCLIVVDTAEGQYFDVTSGDSIGKDTAMEPFCDETERVAGMAIETISASR